MLKIIVLITLVSAVSPCLGESVLYFQSVPCGTGSYPYGGPVALVEGYNYTLASPGYPGSYGTNEKCTWEFIAPKGKEVEILFEHFEVS